MSAMMPSNRPWGALAGGKADVGFGIADFVALAAIPNPKSHDSTIKNAAATTAFSNCSFDLQNPVLGLECAHRFF